MPAIDPLEEVNAAGKKTVLPVPGTALSTPVTDQTNLNVAGAMERGDIGNRFGFGSTQYQQGTPTPKFAPDITDITNNVIDSRMAMIAQGKDPDAPARYVGPRRSQELQHEFLALGESKRRNALTEAHTAKLQLDNQLHARAATDFQNFANGLAEITNKYKSGTPEFEQAILQHVGQHPEGARTQAGNHLLSLISKGHDADKAFAERSYWQRFGQAFKEASVAARKAGVDVQYDEQGFPSIEATMKQAGATPDTATLEKDAKTNWGVSLAQIRHPVKVEVVKADPNDASGFSGSDTGDKVRLDTGAKKGSIIMPKEEYERLGGPLAEKHRTKPEGKSTTEIIPSGGHHYEVDHANKKVIRQID